MTESGKYQFVAGSSIVLPCEVSQPGESLTVTIIQYSISSSRTRHPALMVEFNIISPVSGAFVIAWKRGIAILTAGNVKVSPDPRVSLTKGHYLQIANAVPQDGGEYVCQIATLEPVEITHLVEILGSYLPPL